LTRLSYFEALYLGKCFSNSIEFVGQKFMYVLRVSYKNVSVLVFWHQNWQPTATSKNASDKTSEKEVTMAEAPSSSSQPSNVEPLALGVAVKYWIQTTDRQPLPDGTHERIFDATHIEPAMIGLSPGQIATKVRAHLLKIPKDQCRLFCTIEYVVVECTRKIRSTRSL